MPQASPTFLLVPISRSFMSRPSATSNSRECIPASRTTCRRALCSYGFDRDTQIGTGATSLVLGGFWRGMITGDNAWQYFTQAQLLQPLLTHSEAIPTFGSDPGGYHPGIQIDAATGVFYNNWYHVGPFDKIAPVLQLIYSHREPDSGAAADPADTGYDRLYISPGIDFTKVADDPNNRTFKLYGDIEIPIYQRMNGNQLVSPFLSKLILAYTF